LKLDVGVDTSGLRCSALEVTDNGA
jgi:hypothetical protein